MKLLSWKPLKRLNRSFWFLVNQVCEATCKPCTNFQSIGWKLMILCNLDLWPFELLTSIAICFSVLIGEPIQWPQYTNSVQLSRVPILRVSRDCTLLAEKSIVFILQEHWRCFCGVRLNSKGIQRVYRSKVSKGCNGSKWARRVDNGLRSLKISRVISNSSKSPRGLNSSKGRRSLMGCWSVEGV